MRSTRPNSVHIPVGNSGFYSEFIVEGKDSKACIKHYFASNKVHYSPIEMAQEQYREKQPASTMTVATVVVDKPHVRTRVTIAELLNPETK